MRHLVAHVGFGPGRATLKSAPMFQELVPYALGGTALLVSNEFDVRGDESAMSSAMPALEDDALLVCHLLADVDPTWLNACRH